MDCAPEIRVDWSPAEVPANIYRRLFLSWRTGLQPGQVLPRISCRGFAIHGDPKKLNAYCRVTRSNLESKGPPLLYPHALLGSAHLLIISHAQFPLGALGLLHLRNHVIRYRTMEVDAPWDLKCELSRQRNVEKGLEFDFDSTVTVDGELVWQSISTYLKRGKRTAKVEASPLSDLFPPLAETSSSESFDVPSDIGKQYARVTGDYNPIHVSTLAAKVFGFKRAIAHGMWSVARTLGTLPHIAGPVRLDVAFKGPMFTGSQAAVAIDSSRFDVFCDRNPRPVIVGTCRSAEPGETLF